jgi:hypothetical protein
VDWRWRRWIRHPMHDSLEPTKWKFAGLNEGRDDNAVCTCMVV